MTDDNNRLVLRTKKKHLITSLANIVGDEIPNNRDELLNFLNRLFEKYEIVGSEKQPRICLCGTKSKNNFIIRAIENHNNSFYVGNSCVDYFSSLSRNYEELFKNCIIRNRERNRDKKIIDNNLLILNGYDEIKRYNSFAKYKKIKSDNFKNKYYLFEISKVYIEFLNILYQNYSGNLPYWEFNGNYYIKFHQDKKFRFRFNTEYKIRFQLKGHKLIIESVKRQDPICLIDNASDSE